MTSTFVISNHCPLPALSPSGPTDAMHALDQPIPLSSHPQYPPLTSLHSACFPNPSRSSASTFAKLDLPATASGTALFSLLHPPSPVSGAHLGQHSTRTRTLNDQALGMLDNEISACPSRHGNRACLEQPSFKTCRVCSQRCCFWIRNITHLPRSWIPSILRSAWKSLFQEITFDSMTDISITLPTVLDNSLPPTTSLSRPPTLTSPSSSVRPRVLRQRSLLASVRRSDGIFVHGQQSTGKYRIFHWTLSGAGGGGGHTSGTGVTTKNQRIYRTESRLEKKCAAFKLDHGRCKRQDLDQRTSGPMDQAEIVHVRLWDQHPGDTLFHRFPLLISIEIHIYLFIEHGVEKKVSLDGLSAKEIEQKLATLAK